MLACKRRDPGNYASRILENASTTTSSEVEALHAQLTKKLLDLDVSERFVRASALVGLFFADWTEIVQAADAEDNPDPPDEPLSWAVLSALNVNPAKMAKAFAKALHKAGKAEDDQAIKECYSEWTDTVYGKLKSW